MRGHYRVRRALRPSMSVVGARRRPSKRSWTGNIADRLPKIVFWLNFLNFPVLAFAGYVGYSTWYVGIQMGGASSGSLVFGAFRTLRPHAPIPSLGSLCFRRLTASPPYARARLYP